MVFFKERFTRTLSADDIKSGADAYVYDSKQGRFILAYARWLLFTLSLSGIAAFALVGFLSDHQRNDIAGALFFWYCALIIILQMSVFRAERLRRARYAILTGTALAIIAVIIVYLYGINVVFVVNLVTGIKERAQHAPYFGIINVACITIYSLDSLRRLRTRLKGFAITPDVNLGLTSGITEPERDASAQRMRPSIPALLAADSTAGGIFMGVLAVLFTPQVMAYLFQQFVKPVPFAATPCAQTPCFQLTAPIPAWHDLSNNGLLNNLSFLSLIDFIIALLALIFGLYQLAVVPLMRILGDRDVASATRTAKAREEQNFPILEPANSDQKDDAGHIGEKVASQVAGNVLLGIYRRFDKFLLQLIGDLLLRLRHFLWPPLLFAGIGGLALTAYYQKHYFNLVRSEPDCHTLRYFSGCSPSHLMGVALFKVPQDNGWILVGMVALSALLSILCIVAAMGLLLKSSSVVRNIFHFLYLIGVLLTLVAWIFSLVLSLINFFGSLILNNIAPGWWPNSDVFPQINATVIISSLCFLFFFGPYLVRLLRGAESGEFDVDRFLSGVSRPRRKPTSVKSDAPRLPPETPDAK